MGSSYVNMLNILIPRFFYTLHVQPHLLKILHN